MSRPEHSLFEISWEVCNKRGGVHTFVSSRARTAVDRYGDAYVAVGPWLLREADRELPFEEDEGFADFTAACRARGFPARVGRWRIPGRPRCVLVEFSSLYDRRDDVLAALWRDHGVDSIEGGWDYVEPVLFAYAAGHVVAEWWARYLAPFHTGAVVHAHEWRAAPALLHLKASVPTLGTVFTTHSTAVGRAIAATGRAPLGDLGGRTSAEIAHAHGVAAAHSLEGVAARAADVFTTVSDITAEEAERVHGRRPDAVIQNGIDPDVIDELAGAPDDRDAMRATLEDVARRFLGTPDLGGAALVCTSGRYEFHNKGFDVLIDALGLINRRDGRRLVAFVLVPAGNSGLRGEVRARLDEPPRTAVRDPIGIATHNLFDEDDDPVARRCAAAGLTNATGDRVKVIHVPAYLGPDDGFLGRHYEAVLAAMDLAVFPSFYEPFGYTPQEALAVGVPAVTTDCAGFGRWARRQRLGESDGITILERLGRDDAAVTRELAAALERLIATPVHDREALRAACRATAARTAWTGIFGAYETAYAEALSAAERRAPGTDALPRPVRASLPVEPAPQPAPRLWRFDVATSLPERLRPLERLAGNFWWSWDREAPGLFEAIAPRAWDECRHNPIRFLRRADPAALAQKSADPHFLERLARVAARFDAYLAAQEPSGTGGDGPTAEHPVAYFCAEFGIHESLRIYSGGLGILAGDHVKSASDLRIPLVGIGLFYRMGYMGQRLDAEGRQVVVDVENDPAELPLVLERGADGEPIEVSLPLPGRELRLRAWRVEVGRARLWLLDANLPSNREEDRQITRNLYGGDHEMRIQQLIALGRGGVRLLERLGIEPAVFHLNEGHAAFSTLERIARLVAQGATFEAAREHVRASTAFTTHTPVPAGHDHFHEDLMRRYFSDAPEWVGAPWDRIMRLGKADTGSPEFNMTYLALSCAAWCNGVSRLHGSVSRRLLHPFWPGLLEEEVPIESVTNGVHLATWTSPALQSLLRDDREPIEPGDFVRRGAHIDRRTLWQVRRALKATLAEKVKERVQRAFVERNDSPLLMNRILEGLDERALWIGFARRFAPYKRAHLLYSDLERLLRILDDPERPVRVLVAGKAHPRDAHGQEILRGIAALSRRDDLAGRLVFLENYDVDLARALVQGVDVWLNTPTRMLEASGTSGMKAAANGVLNLSIADGWWPEAADGRNGWTIGDGRLYDDQSLQDQLDAATLYRMLEEDIVPAYFRRDADGIPRDWLELVAHDLATIPGRFNTHRMLEDYRDAAYRPLAENCFALRRDKELANRAAGEARRIRRGFDTLRILEARVPDLADVRVGDRFEAWMKIDLGELRPDDVDVELVMCRDLEGGSGREATVVPMQLTAEGDRNVRAFAASYRIEHPGRHAHGMRIRPRRHSSSPSSLRDLVLWA